MLKVCSQVLSTSPFYSCSCNAEAAKLISLSLSSRNFMRCNFSGLALEPGFQKQGLERLEFSRLPLSSNAKFKLNVSGSIHEADRCFSNLSRGEQCAFMLCYVQIQVWQCHVIKAFDDKTIPDVEKLSPTFLPNRVRWFQIAANPSTPNQNASKQLENLFWKVQSTKCVSRFV